MNDGYAAPLLYVNAKSVVFLGISHLSYFAYKRYIKSFLLFFIQLSKLNNVLGMFNILNKLFFSDTKYKYLVLHSSRVLYNFVTYGEVIANGKALHTSFMHNQLINTPKGQYYFPPGQSFLLR